MGRNVISLNLIGEGNETLDFIKLDARLFPMVPFLH